MPYVFSTATNNTVYVEYGEPVAGGLPPVKRRVTINGGANLPTKLLVTPQGVATKITDDEAAFLRTNKAFIRHSNAGFMKLQNGAIIGDAQAKAGKVAADMTAKDKSAPKTAADFKDKVTTGAIA